MDSQVEDQLPSKSDSDWYKRKGFVYFISAGSNCDHCNSIKIGVSTREGLLNRLRSIQSANHTQIRLLALLSCETMEGAEKVETKLHQQFKSLARVPHGTLGYEWFTASPELMTHIEQQTKPTQESLRDVKNGEIIVKLFAGESNN